MTVKNFYTKIEGENIYFLIGSGASPGYINTLSIGKEGNNCGIKELLTVYISQKMAQAFLKFLFFDLSVKNGLVMHLLNHSSEAMTLAYQGLG
ncbi:hypothetical protein [Lactiplantibacillus plantarum]|uniref:hypothetical protein n=1 Tax=Lactiplantibacillus plantarum TaxID=1590 RepID=UPI0020BD9EDF|nr:hypothetical protein [Lactiplantibacillus plantarum]MCK8475150.1 hypothetical protein [Lactiplantibacillus plantarum]